MMKASEIRKEDLTSKEINEIISSNGLLSISSDLLKWLKKSRDSQLSSMELLELQGEIAIKMIKCEKQISILKDKVNRQEKNIEWRSREIYKAHRRMLKTIMDGIAFRMLNFERPVLRQLAEHHQTGHLSKGFLEELKRAEYIVQQTGFYVILNDLTNFLRYGDLTIISPEGRLIDEVKTKGTSKGNQKKSLDRTIEALNKKVFTAGDQIAEYISIWGKPSSFLKEVEEIINKSMKNEEGVFGKRVSPYLWVSSVHIPKLKSYFKTNNKLPTMPVHPFSKQDNFTSINSLSFFDMFSPNTMPFSVYPFKEEVIVDIMTGQTQLKAVLSEKALIGSFNGKGWQVKMPSKKEIVELYDTDDIEKIMEAVVNPKFHIILKKGRFNYKIPREVMLRVQFEFRSVKAIIDESEGLMLAMLSRKTDMVTTNFTEEGAIWK